MRTGRRRPFPTLGVALLVAAATQIYPAVSPAQAATDRIDRGAVSITKTVTRTHLEANGTSTAVDSREVTLNVSQTKGLRGRQPVRVSWSGAHPSGGVIADPTAETANAQEYPFVLVQCRGVDSDQVPAGERISPATCWTGSMSERVAVDSTSAFGEWRLDRYETPENRAARPGIPTPLPKACATEFATRGRWVHFVSASGVDFASEGTGDGPLGACGNSPAESVVVQNAAQPSNNQYVATGADGTGNTKFTTWTSEDNASLGCTDTIPCSLVAIPIMGISCDDTGRLVPAADVPPSNEQAADTKRCRAGGYYKAGAQQAGFPSERAVTGALWWSESNWRNRISVPLSFAPLASICDLVSGKDSVDVYGSELLTSLTALWRPAFCLDAARTPFKHVQLPEPQAANLLRSGNIKAAFVSRPPEGGFPVGTVTAPLAVTGFAISYNIDGTDHDPYPSLRLTPRLLLKLLTASYPGILAVRQENLALSRNPLDITADPEFRALNPGIPPASGPAAAALVNLSSDSDVVHALTSYLNADAAARDFLYGVPDPWGMVINPAYRRLALPVSNWPLLDDFAPTKFYASGNNLCLQTNPVPIVPLIQAPTQRLSSIASTVQFAVSTSQLSCSAIDGVGALGAKLVGLGREAPGRRFVLGLTSLADAARYDLDTASLQTTVASSAAEKFVDAKGRAFVAPSQDSLRTAASRLVLDEATGTWVYPYTGLNADAAGTSAYPGTMMVSLAVASKGLSPSTARGYAELLDYAAGAGQQPGLDVGQLPPGYLPLTRANGLARPLDQLERSVSVVRAQSGATVMPLASAEPIDTAVPRAPAAAPSSNSGSGSGSGSHSGGSTALPPSSSVPGALPAPAPQPGPVAAPAPMTTAIVPPEVATATGLTPAGSSSLSSSLFPLLLALAGMLGLASGLLGRRPRAAL